MSFRIDRDDRVLIGLSGCFAHSQIIDLTLDRVSDADFQQVKRLLEALGGQEKLETDGVCSSNGYVVQLGNRLDSLPDLSIVFNGHFKSTPRVIEQAIEVLKPYMPKV